MILSLISQKGGVGKSTLARLLAAEFARAGWAVKVADLDPSQGTATKWALRRDQMAVDPEIPVQKYRDATRQSGMRRALTWQSWTAPLTRTRRARPWRRHRIWS